VTRWIWTLAIAALLALTAALPYTDLGRRGSEARLRQDVATRLQEGGVLPPLALEDLKGRRVDVADWLGHRVLLTFERSVDW
jgi:cytochrome oxidase Cu insertion factor (SCO1/SenC/PrrC family)